MIVKAENFRIMAENFNLTTEYENSGLN